MRSFLPKGHNRLILTSDNPKLRSWRQEVSKAALVAMKEAGTERIVKGTPISLRATFSFALPKSSKKGRIWKTERPDLDKLLRAISDSLSGICFDDDSQIVTARVSKFFDLPERVHIQIAPVSLFMPPPMEDLEEAQKGDRIDALFNNQSSDASS